MTYRFCALWRRYKSHSVNAIIASAIGTALMPTQGSCLPFVLIVVGLFLISTVLPGTKMLDVGYNTMIYSESEVQRITQFAIEAAKNRQKQITSIDKANVLECSQLWRQTVDSMMIKHSDIDLQHMYVDNAAMQIIKNPKQFDVILTPNLFGDILSDAASMLTGSIGLLPSASLSNDTGMFEPIHGSAPDIAGQGIVNPLAMILSLAMMFEYTLDKPELSKIIKKAVDEVLNDGYFTKDLSSKDFISTSQMGDKILERIKKQC